MKEEFKSKKKRKLYSLDQCALFKIGSKKRLAAILRVSQDRLEPLGVDKGNYFVFTLKEQICPFTGKVKGARRVQNPLPELKLVQRRILSLLARVEMPEFCHGAKQGSSYRSNAKAHVDAKNVATFDLKSFFPSTSASRVFSFFRNTLQCAPDVARILTKLCVCHGALATGSPVSPILAYWANCELFRVLNRLAEENHLLMTVYIDDFTISGDVLPRNIVWQVKSIVEKYGHSLSLSKTKIFRENEAKHVTGLVIYEGNLTVPHIRFKKARAIEKAIAVASNDEERLDLMRKMGGLLGEAAYVDKRYKSWAFKIYSKISQAQSVLRRKEASASEKRKFEEACVPDVMPDKASWSDISPKAQDNSSSMKS
ncbi:reverse transcriptase family protein [Azohydromonas caseinilytica]|uniref:RNA-directed DNA polymerase n=1 Tax=Azohydromonas caseinilytica TaxID=2728836 RepID=A0A848FFQ0_9BURK|nr:reverse transcriptase family protein [Azohydromonas caseinilytica]NML19057.1 RNA-directed DNA polymerase [Azohydromonas caseinilytica]